MTIFDQPVARWMILHIINGDLFYLSIVLLTGALYLATTSQSNQPSRIRRTTTSLGLSLGIISLVISLASVTLPWLFYLSLTALAFKFKTTKIKPVLITAWLFTLIIAILSTWNYETGARYPTEPFDHIAVFGDSLSVEFGSKNGPAWNRHLSLELGIASTNYAAKGATVADTLHTFNANPIENHLVILVISGNDFLSATHYPDYVNTLDQLFQAILTHNNQILFVEIPTPPTTPHFAWAQRRIANKYNTRLVPKRALSNVLFKHPGATVDGLHLTSYGHQILGNRLSQYLQ